MSGPIITPVIAGASPVQSVVPDDTVIADGHEGLTRFSDLVWNLAPLLAAPNVPASNKVARFDFDVTPGCRASTIPSQTLILTAKEFAYARLLAPPSGMRRKSPNTVIIEACNLSLFGRWLARRAIMHYTDVTPELLDEFRDHLLGNPTWEIGDRKGGRQILQVALILRTVQRLWEYRDRLTVSLPFHPWRGANPRVVIGFQRHRGEENLTPPIPDEIMAAIGHHAVRYVEHFSRDIIDLRISLETARAERIALGYPRNRVTADIGGWLFRKLTRGLALKADPDTGRPWRTVWGTYSDFRHEERMLIAACFIVVAWLSGMRVSEILAIRDNAVISDRSLDGIMPLLRVRSTLFKGIPEPQGRPETWTIVPIVAAALETMAAASAYQRSDGADVIFRTTAGDPLKTFNINEYVNLFREHVSALFPTMPIPPAEDGQRWHFNTRQFRRTLARHIARQPFGVIAGMLQYKHVHVATFEGYAGADNLGTWRKLLAQERQLANADFLEDVAHDVVGGNIAGPKGQQMVQEFRGVAGDRRDDDVAYYLRHKAKDLYPGPLSYCFFEPETAMCLSSVKIDAQPHPVVSHCHPDRCANSCITAKHKPAWDAAIADAVTMRRTPKLSPLQRLALDQEIARMRCAIAHLHQDAAHGA